MDAELRHHVDSHAEDLIRTGVPRDEALRQAKVALGGIDRAKEECRDAIGVSFLESLLQDVRFGLRMLRKNPGFTAIAVLTLALGIGATTAIFSVVNAVLLKPLAMEDPSRVVYVQEQWQNIFPDLSVGNFADFQRESMSFESLCGSNDASFNLATREAPERVEGALATAGCFSTFGVRPIAGRVFTSDEDQPGRAQVVVISERLWRERLHADSAIIGQQLHINAIPYTVIGIMPKTFDPLLNNTELWIPEAFSPEKIANHDEHYLTVIGRRKPGVSLAQMQSELNVIALRLQQQYPIDDKGRGFRVTPLATALLGDQRLALRMMLAAVGFLLLIACANVANLQLARSRLRQKEIALRAALGASPRRSMRQLLMENVVLGFGGGGAGVLLAFAAVSWIVAYGPAGVPRLDQAHIDARTLAFACGVALLSSFAFGLAPALRSASTRLNDAFKQGDARLTGSRDRIRSIIVTAEVALALVLMAGAGLLVRSALLVSRVSPGFDASNVIAGRVGLPDAGYGDPSHARHAFEQMIAATSALPGVESAAVVSRAPLAGGGSSNGLIPEGKALDPSNIINASLQITSPGYLATIRIPLKSGRDFDVSDTRNNALVAIVNETLARTAWPNESAIGKRFACCESGPKGRTDDPVWHEVIGVAADVRAWGLDRQFQPEFYIPLAQMPPSAWDWIGRTMDLVVRTKGRAVPVSELRAAVASVAPGVPMYQVSTMQQKISATLQQSRFETFLLTIFAAAALLLATVGVYGVLSFTVTQRTRDIGIRMALGATQAHVMRDVLAYGMRLTALGVVLGFAGALSGTRVLASLLYGVHPTDALTFAAVSSLLVVVALVASYLPARRAARVDPMVALRHE
jgi:predicted permease